MSDSKPTAPTSGHVVGDKYRLLTELGTGGMGSEWVAHNELLDVEVAIKFIRADLAGLTEARLADRLLREARAAARPPLGLAPPRPAASTRSQEAHVRLKDSPQEEAPP